MNSPARNRSFRLIRMMVVAIPALFAAAALAKDTRWTSSTSPYWNIADNWSKGMAGSEDPAGEDILDTAFFSSANAVTHVLLTNDIYLGRITFDASAATLGEYVIGEPDGPAIHLTFTGGYYENHCSAGTHPNIRQTIAAPIKVYSNYQFYSDSADPSSVFILGDISSGTSSGADVQLKGSNTGRNEVVGIVSDGAGVTRLTKLNAGNWTVSGTNTFTGPLTVSGGMIVAGADVPASGPSPFGARPGTSSLVQVGSPNPSTAGTSLPCGVLAGATADGVPVTIARRIDVNANNRISTWPQDTLVGGANTNGTSRFTGFISSYRPFFLVCATGGRVAFEGNGNVGPRTAICSTTIGYPGYEGTVAILGNFTAQAAGLFVSSGTFEADAVVSSPMDIPVADGATICGTGSIRTNVVVAVGGTLSGGTNGVGTLTITGDATLASGAILAFPAKDAESPFLAVSGVLSLDGAVIQVDRNVNPPGKPCVVACATGGIVGEPNLSGVPKAFTVRVTDTEIILSYRHPTIMLVK